jgi:hypothetical protein
MARGYGIPLTELAIPENMGKSWTERLAEMSEQQRLERLEAEESFRHRREEELLKVEDIPVPERLPPESPELQKATNDISRAESALRDLKNDMDMLRDQTRLTGMSPEQTERYEKLKIDSRAWRTREEKYWAHYQAALKADALADLDTERHVCFNERECATDLRILVQGIMEFGLSDWIGTKPENLGYVVFTDGEFAGWLLQTFYAAVARWGRLVGDDAPITGLLHRKDIISLLEQAQGITA